MAGRRDFLTGAAAIVVLPLAPAHATPETMAAAIKEVTRGAEVHVGKVKLDLPPLVENGNTVPLSILVDSPMTDAGRVKAIHIFNEKNPQPHVFTARFGPGNGKPFLATRIKLADAQKVVAIAELGDGSYWSASADVIVTIAACIEDIT